MPTDPTATPELVSAIRGEIAACGPIPFARFMELTLYHPAYGYYTSFRERIGQNGDYYTSSSVHPIFGALIARQIAQVYRTIACTDRPFVIAEIGSGKGTLCSDILETLQKYYPDCYAQTEYHLVEKGRLAAMSGLVAGFPGRVRLCDALTRDVVGVVLSNELIDAFPVHRMQYRGTSLLEVHVDWQKGRFVECLRAPSSPALPTYIARLGISFNTSEVDDVAFEINLAALSWIRHVASCLSRGMVITIDYGYLANVLYGAHRKRGTFLCYTRHAVSENPYDRVGAQDMTSHVDFTSLIEAGIEAGLSFLGLTDQTRFLMGLGIADSMESLAGRMETSPDARSAFLAMKHLMAPSQMGGTFKVLLQGKGLPGDFSPEGLQYQSAGKMSFA